MFERLLSVYSGKTSRSQEIRVTGTEEATVGRILPRVRERSTGGSARVSGCSSEEPTRDQLFSEGAEERTQVRSSQRRTNFDL